MYEQVQRLSAALAFSSAANLRAAAASYAAFLAYRLSCIFNLNSSYGIFSSMSLNPSHVSGLLNWYNSMYCCNAFVGPSSSHNSWHLYIAPYAASRQSPDI